MKFNSTKLFLTSLFFPFTAIQPVLSQVTSDGTTSTTVTPTATGVEINDGDVAGGNLVHSFGDFSVPAGSEAFFNNADDISNIFSRVTGGNISNIDGILRANGAANLFLINPAGIVFGEGARLQLGGSFYGSTADSIVFPDGEFSATDLDNPPLITINAPIGVNFREEPQPITNRANFGLTEITISPGTETEYTPIVDITGLEVAEGKTLALIGGDIILERGGLTAPGGKIDLGGLSQAGTVEINTDGSLSLPEGVTRSDVSLSDHSRVDTRGNGGGAININTRNLTLEGKSRITAGIAEGMGSEDAVAGDIVINATDSVEIIGTGDFPSDPEPPLRIDTAIGNSVGLPPELRANPEEDSTAVGQGGSIFIDTKLLDVSVRDAGIFSVTYGTGNSGIVSVEAETINLTGSAMGTITFGKGNALDVNLNAKDINLEPGVIISQVIGDDAEGNTGDINITADRFKTDGEGNFISTDNGSQNQGDAGDINITASESISLESLTMLSVIQPGASGDSGDIRFVAPEINISQTSYYSFIGAENRSITGGQGGDITIEATESLSIGIGGQLSATVPEGAVGDAGNVSLTAPSINLEETDIIVSTSGQGDGGDITLTATDSLNVINESLVLSQVKEGADGNAGNIDITAGSLNLENESFILSDTYGLGNAGQISIEIEDTLSLDTGSAIVAGVEENGMGNGSDIIVTSPNIFVTNGSSISSSTEGQGDAGNLQITTDLLSVNNFADISSSTNQNATGEGGTIDINANSIDLYDGGGISAYTSSVGDGGEINITANNLELKQGSAVFTGADSTGNAGNIFLDITESIIADRAIPPTRPSTIAPPEDPFSDFLGGGTGLFANTSPISTGDGGNITVNTNRIVLENGAEVNADSLGTGAGGSIKLDSRAVNLDSGQISATTTSLQEGNNSSLSNIDLSVAENLTLRNNSQISTEAGSNANAGNIDINAEFIVAYPSNGDGNDIVAKAKEGEGGDINIVTEGLFGMAERNAFTNNETNDIDASSELGVSGNVSITTPDNNSLRETPELSNNIVSQNVVAASDSCAAASEDEASGLVVRGKGGVPPQPTEPFHSEEIITEEVRANSHSSRQNNSDPDESSQETETTNNYDPNYIPPHIKPVTYDENGEPIYIARGLIVKPDGGIILTAYPTENVQPRNAEKTHDCNE